MTTITLQIHDRHLDKLESLRVLTGQKTIQDALLHAGLNYASLSKANRHLTADSIHRKDIAANDQEIADTVKKLKDLL